MGDSLDLLDLFIGEGSPPNQMRTASERGSPDPGPFRGFTEGVAKFPLTIPCLCITILSNFMEKFHKLAILSVSR
jgi:hypothetical protein